MSEEPRRSSHATTWTLGVVGALVLYVLSVGPVGFAFARINPHGDAPVWAKEFYAPLIWLHDHTFLDKPLESYENWWENLAKRP